MNAALPLHVDGLRLRAGGLPRGRVLIDQLQLNVQPGQRWALLGPNGAGKSTLLAALAGLTMPDAGFIRLGDTPLQDFSPEQLARRRAWCPQFWLDPFSISVRDVVASAAQAGEDAAGRADENARVQARLQELDAAHLANRDVRTLSGGERQRVALATACAQNAPLLLLDEPTAHLDWAHQAALGALLKRWSGQQGSVIAAVHDLNLAWALATHALLLDGKGGAQAGSRAEILTAENLTAAYGVAVSVRSDETTGDECWFRVDLTTAGKHP